MMVDDMCVLISRIHQGPIYRNNIPGVPIRDRTVISAVCGIAVCFQTICGTVSDFNKTTITLISDGGDSTTENLREERPVLTVYIRSNSIENSRAELEDIERLMLSSFPAVIGGTHYYHAFPTGALMMVHKDPLGRFYIHAQNYTVDFSPQVTA